MEEKGEEEVERLDSKTRVRTTDLSRVGDASQSLRSLQEKKEDRFGSQCS